MNTICKIPRKSCFASVDDDEYMRFEAPQNKLGYHFSYTQVCPVDSISVSRLLRQVEVNETVIC